MERYTVTASYKRGAAAATAGGGGGGLSQRPAVILQAPAIPLPPKPQLRELPISSHLRLDSPRALTRRAAAEDDAELSIFDAERYFNEGVKTAVVLGGGSTTEVRTLRGGRPNAEGGQNGRCAGPYYSTAAASSEASWNSRTGLLANPRGSGAASDKAAKDRRRLPPASPGRRFFGRNCPCSGKKSVDVDDKYSEPRSPTVQSNVASATIPSGNVMFGVRKQSFGRTGECGLSSIPEMPTTTKVIKNEFGVIEEVTTVKITPGNWVKDATFIDCATVRLSLDKPFTAEMGHRIVNTGRPFAESGGFSFPILDASTVIDVSNEPPRESLEVFLPPEEPPVSRKSSEVQQKAVVPPLSGEGGRRSFTYASSPKIRALDDDAASDASSDLFEIESFSTSYATSYRRRDSMDEPDSRRLSSVGVLQFRRSFDDAAATASIAPSECYPPSEVSVQWSVTTAEGFDRASVANFSSAASDCGDLRFGHADHAQSAAAGRRKNATGGGLLSCRSEKAVNVAANPVRFAPTIEPEVRMTRFTNGTSGLVHVRACSARMIRPVESR